MVAVTSSRGRFDVHKRNVIPFDSVLVDIRLVRRSINTPGLSPLAEAFTREATQNAGRGEEEAVRKSSEVKQYRCWRFPLSDSALLCQNRVL